MKHLGLFEGIGGFSLAAKWMGWETVAWCEWNEFEQKVLTHHFPNAEGHGDITKTDFTKYANQIDIVTGGFPCQPYSNAGLRKGKEDDRHLWPEMLRAIKEIQPCWIVGENVSGLINWNGGMVFNEVQTDLETAGYEVWPYVLPACAVNAPHRRDRVWFVAYSRYNTERKNRSCNTNERSELTPVHQERQIGECKTILSDGFCDIQGIHSDSNGTGREKLNTSSKPIKEKFNSGNAMYTNSPSKQGKHIGQKREGKLNGSNSRNGINNFQNFPTQSPICSGDDGISNRLDGITFSKWRNESIKAYGNAIVPQVAFQIFKAIEQMSMQL